MNINVVISFIFLIIIIISLVFIFKNEKHEKFLGMNCPVKISKDSYEKKIIPSGSGLFCVSGLGPGNVLAFIFDGKTTLYALTNSKGEASLSKNQTPLPIECIKNKVQVVVLDEKLNPVKEDTELIAHFLVCEVFECNKDQTYLCDNLYNNHQATILIKDGVVGVE